jgi:hypothetical protein
MNFRLSRSLSTRPDGEAKERSVVGELATFVLMHALIDGIVLARTAVTALKFNRSCVPFLRRLCKKRTIKSSHLS